MAKNADEMTKLLDAAYDRDMPQLVTAVCVSAASFIAEIDASSGDVAAYLEQRFGTSLRALYYRGGRNALLCVAEDGRKLPASK